MYYILINRILVVYKNSLQPTCIELTQGEAFEFKKLKTLADIGKLVKRGELLEEQDYV